MREKLLEIEATNHRLSSDLDASQQYASAAHAQLQAADMRVTEAHAKLGLKVSGGGRGSQQVETIPPGLCWVHCYFSLGFSSIKLNCSKALDTLSL